MLSSPAILGPTIAWPGVRFRADFLDQPQKFRSCHSQSPPNASRSAQTRGVISHGEKQNERWVAPLCPAGSGAIMASIAASGASAAASDALRRLRALDRRDLSRRDERSHRRMQRHHDLIR